MFTGFSLWLLQLDCDLLRSLAPFGSPSQPSRYSASWSLSVEPVLVQFKFCSHTERKEDHRNDLLPFGSSNWTRTSDTLINSQVLYRLSYGGIKDERLEIALTSSYVGEYRFSRAVAGEVS